MGLDFELAMLRLGRVRIAVVSCFRYTAQDNLQD